MNDSDSIVESWDGVSEFVAVVETGSFVHAAERLGVSTAHVSRAVAGLEKRLNNRLLYRSTRRISLTDLGKSFFEDCRRLVSERSRIFADAMRGSEPSGHLNITCPLGYGERFVAPVLGDFLELHQDVSINVTLTNDVVDLVEKGFEIAIRAIRMTDSRHVQTKIDTRIIHLCATPEYLSTHGEPRHVKDLASHRCLIGVDKRWALQVDGRKVMIRPKGRWQCNNGSVALDAALRGMGICRLPDFYVEEYLATGQLVSLLPECRPDDEHIWAIYPQKDYVNPLVRAVIDYLRVNIPLHRRQQRRTP